MKQKQLSKMIFFRSLSSRIFQNIKDRKNRKWSRQAYNKVKKEKQTQKIHHSTPNTVACIQKLIQILSIKSCFLVHQLRNQTFIILAIRSEFSEALDHASPPFGSSFW